MPYMPYVRPFSPFNSQTLVKPLNTCQVPPTWPVYSPALNLLSWLEYYAEAMELPAWTSSDIISTSQHGDNKWQVKIRRSDKTEREFVVNHPRTTWCSQLASVAAPSGPMTTLGLYVAWSDVPCGIVFNFIQDKFRGEFLHSTEHKRALDHAGKKVVIVGSCTSGERTQPSPPLPYLYVAEVVSTRHREGLLRSRHR